MALARSASGPGGLSINTASANTLFGANSSQPPAASSLFGASQPQTTQASTGSNMFGTTASSTPKTGGLFGAGTTSNTNQTGTTGASGGGLFGAAQPQQQQTAGGGLFGSNTTGQSGQQQAGGGLFGSSTTQQQPQQTGGSLFGNNTQSTQPAQGGGLFGSSTQNSTQTQNTGGLFGSMNKPQPTGGFSLFGQPTQQSQSALGQTQTDPQQSVLGGGLPPLGQSTQTVPGVRIDVSSVKGTSRFNDLHEDLQKKIVEVDNYIQTWMAQKNEADAFMPGHSEQLSYLPNDVKLVKRKYDGVQNALQSDAEAIEGVRGLIEQDANNARLSFRAVDNLKLPQQYHTAGLWSSRQQSSNTANTETDGQDLVSYFSKEADEMDQQLKRHTNTLSEIESHMRGVEDGMLEQLQKVMATQNGGPSGIEEKIADLGAVLRDFEMSILNVAGHVGSAKEAMARLQLGDFMNYDPQRNGMY